MRPTRAMCTTSGSPARWPRGCCDAASRRWPSGRSAPGASAPARRSSREWCSGCRDGRCSAPAAGRTPPRRAPRPTRMRSGRCRSAARSRSAIVTGGQRRLLSERRLRPPRLEAHQVRLVEMNLGRLLDHDDPVRGRECAPPAHSAASSFPCPCRRRSGCSAALATACQQLGGHRRRQRADLDQLVQACSGA